jgi:hypothetical protein
MRIVPGWVVGALGVGAVAGAFFLGGRLAASDLTPSSTATVASAPAPGLPGLEVECEPGQRAVVRQAAAANPGPATVSCVSALPAGYLPAATAGTAAAYPAAQYVTRPAYVTQPYVAPAPRMVRTSTVRTVSRAPAPRVRSAKSSIAIIAGGTAAGAIIGGLADGKKGALIGGLIGGGAATVFDRTTRKKNQ